MKTICTLIMIGSLNAADFEKSVTGELAWEGTIELNSTVVSRVAWNISYTISLDYEGKSTTYVTFKETDVAKSKGGVTFGKSDKSFNWSLSSEVPKVIIRNIKLLKKEKNGDKLFQITYYVVVSGSWSITKEAGFPVEKLKIFGADLANFVGKDNANIERKTHGRGDARILGSLLKPIVKKVRIAR